MNPPYINDEFNLKGTTLRVGTDCSGLDSPIVALEMLNVNVEHIWSCDSDCDVKTQILSKFKPQHYYDDMASRDVSKLPPIDMYIAGIPCQSWSGLNTKRKGFNVKEGTLFFEALKVIKSLRPKFFILENVTGMLTHNKGQSYKLIQSHLESLNNYNIHYKVLNTVDYGTPQNRNRIYIIGIRDCNKLLNILKVPTLPIKNFLNTRLPPQRDKCLIPRRQKCLEFAKEHYDINEADDWIVTIGASFTFTRARLNVCPCITAFASYYYITSQERFITIDELLILQGFPESYKLVTKNKSKCYRQVGNAMSVNVLYHLFYALLENY